MLGQVEGPAVDVTEDLYTRRAKLIDGAVDLSKRGFGVVHGERSHEGWEALGVPGHQRRHLVVGQSGQLRTPVGTRDHLDRRGRQREDLYVIAIAVHDPKSQVGVDEHRNPGNALLHVQAARSDLEHPVEVLAGQDVGKDVDLHGTLRGAVATVWPAPARRSGLTRARPSPNPATSSTATGTSVCGGRMSSVAAAMAHPRRSQPRERKR